MKIFWTLARRELAAFFCSITGYVIISAGDAGTHDAVVRAGKILGHF